MNDQTLLDRAIENFFGKFIILPGQYAMLDNQVIELTRNRLRIIIGGNPNKTLDYNIKDIKIRYFNAQPVNALQLNISSMDKYNMSGADDISNLIVELLYLRAPGQIYIVYDSKMGIFMLKNINMATVAVLKKMD